MSPIMYYWRLKEMRRTINVLWLDDIANDDASGVDYLQEAFTESLRKQGYLSNIITIPNIDEAKEKINDSSIRIDFFVSDYNLDGKKSGITFLNDIRKMNRLKEHFILYSNNDTETIRTCIIKEINEENNLLDNLNNYSFFSTASNSSKSLLIKRFTESIALALSRWEELSALRGEFASLNTLAEWIAKRIMYTITSDSTFIAINSDSAKTYSAAIGALKNAINSGQLLCNLDNNKLINVFDNWYACKETRNDLEHNTEKWDSVTLDYYVLRNDGSGKIYEKKIAEQRNKLINQMSSVCSLFDDLINLNEILGFLESESDYISFKELF